MATEVRELDVSVLRLRPGDLLVAHISEELGALEGLAESVVEAVQEALRKAGHDKVGSLIVAGEIRFEIVRQEGNSERVARLIDPSW